MSEATAQFLIEDLFTVRSGDYHSVAELAEGVTPLISCGDADNGLVGFYDIPDQKTYCGQLTVAYNGSWPLLTKFHPYRFGAKDDVAVLLPLHPLRDTTLCYVAALLNRMTWRYSYGRKCFREKLAKVSLRVPVARADGADRLDEDAVAHLLPSGIMNRVVAAAERVLAALPA